METAKFYGVGPQEQFNFEVDGVPFGPDVRLFATLPEAQAHADQTGWPLLVLDAMSEEQIPQIIEAHADYLAAFNAQFEQY